MNELKLKQASLLRRKHRIRSKISGSSVRPRLSVKISLKNVSAQLIDDQKGTTLLSASTINNKTTAKMNLTQQAEYVGNELATKAIKAKIKSAVLDRNGKIYHGRIKALTEAARKAGLEI